MIKRYFDSIIYLFFSLFFFYVVFSPIFYGPQEAVAPTLRTAALCDQQRAVKVW